MIKINLLGETAPGAGYGRIWLAGYLASLAVLAVAVAVDSSAAFLHRQRLDNVAEGAALYAANIAASIADGIQLARETIASGAARRKLDQFVATTKKLGG